MADLPSAEASTSTQPQPMTDEEELVQAGTALINAAMKGVRKQRNRSGEGNLELTTVSPSSSSRPLHCSLARPIFATRAVSPCSLPPPGSARLANARQTSDDVYKLLKEADAPAWYQDELGWTAMHYAAEREDEKMVKVLLARGGVWNAGESRRES
jgi:ankyrin repeat protein